jgi:hypothetical protein
MVTGSAPVLIRQPSRAARLGWAWVAMWIALAIHVTDKALTGFLAVYNPTVLALRARFGFWPMPTFSFRGWLSGLGLMLAALLGHTVSTVRFPRPAPGFYSSPLLLTASRFALIELWRTRTTT